MKKPWDNWILVVGMVLLTSCGGGGGGGSGPANTAPVANAGRGIKALKNALVALDGSASSDADGDALTYNWVIISSPPSSTPSLTNSSSAFPLFMATVPGVYTVGLVVNDGKTNSAAVSVDVLVLSTVSNIHDTGLDKCYGNSSEITCPGDGTPFSGQDAQYSTNSMVFVDDGAVVTDSLTGLSWQKTDSTTRYNWYEAAGVFDSVYNASSINVCGSLNLGGHTDWRLPTRRELVSIMNYSQAGPDAKYFQNSGPYWTSTRIGSVSAMNVWIVEGSLVSSALAYQGGLSAPYGVKCVRGAVWGQSTTYVNNGDQTVTDSMSGLRWQKNDDGVARNWEAALAYCENLALAGFTDWRLPDIKEMESLVYIQASNFSQPLNSAYFTASVDANGLKFYWSSTTRFSYGTALGIDFNIGSVEDGGFSKNFYKFTRCVR